jgi:hypothetical protein
MRQIALPLLGSMALLVGCTQSDIDMVKTMPLPENNTFTTSQAFDHRQVCASVAWTKTDDDRGRRIVEYRCTVKGIAEWVDGNVGAARRAVRDEAQLEKNRYLDQIKALRTRITDAKQATAQPVSTANLPLDPLSIEITQSRDILESGDIEAILARDYGQRYVTFNNAVAQYRAYRNAPQQVATPAYSRWDRMTPQDPTNAADKRFDAEKQSTIQTMNADLADLQQRAVVEQQQVLAYKSQTLQSTQAQLDSLIADQQSAFADIDQRMKDQLAAIANDPIVGVDEVFRWTINDRTIPTMVYAGTETRFKDATTDDHEYQSQEKAFAIQTIINNKATTYAEFRQAPAVITQVAAMNSLPIVPVSLVYVARPPVTRIVRRTILVPAPQPDPPYPGLGAR